MEKNGITGSTSLAPAQKTSTAKKEHFFANVRAEFKRIRFPDAQTTVKTTGFVLATACISGAVIAAYNAVITYAISFLL